MAKTVEEAWEGFPGDPSPYPEDRGLSDRDLFVAGWRAREAALEQEREWRVVLSGKGYSYRDRPDAERGAKLIGGRIESRLVGPWKEWRDGE